jgi:hypothetical protein
MNKRNFLGKYKDIFIGLLFISFVCTSMRLEAMQNDEKKKVDLASIEFPKRPDVQSAVNKLTIMCEKLESLVHKIYNAYVPYTIGEGDAMRKRMKSLTFLIKSIYEFDLIRSFYVYYMDTKLSYDEKMKVITDNVRFHYFNSNTNRYDGKGLSIIADIGYQLEKLCEDPQFPHVTHFKKEHIEPLEKELYQTIDQLIKTLPGGNENLK